MQLKPDMILYGAVMNGCGSALLLGPADRGEKAHQWQLAMEVFAMAERLPVSLMAVCTAMAALGRGSCWAEALEMLSSLPQRQLQHFACRNA